MHARCSRGRRGWARYHVNAYARDLLRGDAAWTSYRYRSARRTPTRAINVNIWGASSVLLELRVGEDVRLDLSLPGWSVLRNQN